MTLPAAWVDRIFAKLSLVYGSGFMRQWEGMNLDAVKDDWASELAGLQQSPQSIAYAFEVLPPDRPPNVLQFKALCLKAPQYAPKALPAPAADPDIVKAVMDAVSRPDGFSHRKWAEALRDKERSGYRLGAFQKSAWREALGDAA